MTSPGATDKAAALALATALTGGYKCVRSGLIFAHPQKLDLGTSAGTVITDAGLRAFYGTTAAHIGVNTTPFNFGCCPRLEYTVGGFTTECEAVVDITTTTADKRGNVYNNRAYYKGPSAGADSNMLTANTNVVTWNADFLLAAQW